jgi:hypothetical protein
VSFRILKESDAIIRDRGSLRMALQKSQISKRIIIVRDTKLVVNGGPVLGPTTSKFSLTTSPNFPLPAAGSRLAIRINLEFAATVLAADRFSARVGHLKGVRSLGDVRSLGHSSTLGAGRPPSDHVPAQSRRVQSTGKSYFDFDHKVVSGTAPPSVLKLPTGQ